MLIFGLGVQFPLNNKHLACSRVVNLEFFNKCWPTFSDFFKPPVHLTRIYMVVGVINAHTDCTISSKQ